MSKKITIGAAITFIALAVAITFCVTLLIATNRFNSQLSDFKEKEALYTKLAEVDAVAREFSYFGINSDEINQAIVKGYLSSISDKYARYYSAEDAKAYTEYISGKNSDMGLTVRDGGDCMYVVNVTAGSPVYEAGLRAGMKITFVGDKTYSADGYDALLKALEIKEGDEVILKVLQEDGSEKEYTVKKQEYSVQSVVYKRVDNTAVVTISGFYLNTAQQFKEVIGEITAEENITGIIFDVRNNRGGELESVVEVLDMLLPEGTIVTQFDKEGKELKKYISDGEQINIPMAVLVNGETASAAELFACALKDYNKAVLIGEKTYGKGSAQTTFTLSDGSLLVLTTSMYNPPASKNYDGVGIMPDYEIKLTEEQIKNFYELDETTDPQLKEALSKLSKSENTEETSSAA